MRREQQDDAQYFFQAVTIIIGIAALLITLGTIVATIIGYRLIRRYVEAEFTRRASEAFEEHGRPLLDEGLSDIQAAVEAKLIDLDERFAAEVELFHKTKGADS